jgi:hypothetical protein
MGLLSKAVIKVNPELDEMGKVLRDRILRLPSAKTSPDTALSLLKAYGSFQTGICFFLFRDFYESYASTGARVNKLRIPKDKIKIPAGKEGFYRPDDPDLFSGLFVPKGYPWLFFLDNEKPRKHILLIIEDGVSLFNPDAMAKILPEIREVLTLPPEYEPAPRAAEEDILPDQKQSGTADEIRQYHSSHASFQGIILEIPQGENGETAADFSEKVFRMISAFGSVSSLPAGNCMALFPETIDRELLAHRLSKSLKTRMLYHFQADDPGMAMAQIGPYL